MNSLIPALMTGGAVLAPATYWFYSLPQPLWKHTLAAPSEISFIAPYHAGEDQVCLIDFDRTKVSYSEFMEESNLVSFQSFSRGELRNRLRLYLVPRLFLLRLTPQSHPTDFDTEWYHRATVLAAKAVKEVMISSEIVDYTHELVRETFFVEDRLLRHVNSLMISDIEQVLESPFYYRL